MALFGKNSKQSRPKASGEKRKSYARAASRPHASHDFIRYPWFSEKALIMTEKGVYAFAVPPRATKATIAGAIKELYSVTPKAVRIVNTPGKKKNMRTRRGIGARAMRRKAYVYLNKGDTIQFS